MVIVVAAGLSSVALAGSQGLTPRQQIKKALKLEQSALKNLKAGNDTAADKNLKASQKALDGAANALGPGRSAGWDAYDAWEHDADALDEPCSLCAQEDVKDGIDHKLDALDTLNGRILMIAWGVGDFGGNSLYYRGSGLYSTGYNANSIGNVEGKTVHTYPVPTANAGLRSITEGPDGAMWFTETGANKIGRFAPRTHKIQDSRCRRSSRAPTGSRKAPTRRSGSRRRARARSAVSTRHAQVHRVPDPDRGLVSRLDRGVPDRQGALVRGAGGEQDRPDHDRREGEGVPVPTAGAQLSGIAAGPAACGSRSSGRARSASSRARA